MKVDIIGGGLSGLSTAISIKDHDPSIHVILHEKHSEIGQNRDARKCGEAHCIEYFSKKWTPPAEAIATEIHYGKIEAGKKTYVYKRQPGTAWILDRPKFITSLMEKAKENDVEFILNDRITDVTKLSSDVIVDASGCPSMIRKKLGLPHRYVSYGYQQTLTNCSAYEEKTLKIFFENNGGYYWIFPRHPETREVNLGIGLYLHNHVKLPALLEEFKKEHHITGTIDYSIGGFIPAGLQYPLRYKNIIFVGDAGVGTLPMNGQGIYRALMSGDIAGKYIAQQNLKGYVREIMREFIKMDIIGKTLVRWNSLLYHINPTLVLSSWNYYELFNEKLSFFQSGYHNIE